jgi:putative sigma-54 modulation protein
MPVEITDRHKRAAGGMEEYAREKGDLLIEAFPGVEHVHIILDVEKHRHIAEVVVQARRQPKMEAAESSANMRASIDLAFEKVEKQLRRLRDKIHDHAQAMKHEEAERDRGGATG